MKSLFNVDEWSIVQSKFEPEKQLAAESIFSIGNGTFGQRANFEEHYSGVSLQGSYIGGIYYPDKTKVGWWKNGYPEYFAKVLNSCNWIGIDITIGGQKLDLNKCTVKSFHRELNMYTGILHRKFKCALSDGKEIEVKTKRFCSMSNEHFAAIEYNIIPLNFTDSITVNPYLDFNVKNQDSNYDEKFWKPYEQEVTTKNSFISAVTKKTNFLIYVGMNSEVVCNNEIFDHNELIQDDMYISHNYSFLAKQGNEYSIKKYISIASNLSLKDKEVKKYMYNNLDLLTNLGFDKAEKKHSNAWKEIWDHSDVKIIGDIESQQAIRFNIFQLFQSYNGSNPKLNIGPKGFTGEKYGGSTYWDTEAYCLPFFLKTANSNVSKQLLKYRYNHLVKAKENAKKLGFKDGAALYPMVTMNGEECHNEWEITFEEIHRNGAIAFAICNYYKHTKDYQYIDNYGRDVLIAICRFWKQRVNWSKKKNKFVILGVTGPNEYENNVNNNWYTNYIAKWCLEYTIKIEEEFSKKSESKLDSREISEWKNIINNIFLPKIEGTNIFLQNDGFLDKELSPIENIPINERPICQNWSWDRILRSAYIKQADVLQGLYFFEEHFDKEIIKENIDFYFPLTVHESSLSPCVHSILFSSINNIDKAFEMYLRTSRLDLDDYNNEVDEGLHITSMAGSWLSIVEGFAGVRIKDDGIFISPIIPKKWRSYNFKMYYNNEIIEFLVTNDQVNVTNNSCNNLNLFVDDNKYILNEKSKKVIDL